MAWCADYRGLGPLVCGGIAILLVPLTAISIAWLLLALLRRDAPAPRDTDKEGA